LNSDWCFGTNITFADVMVAGGWWLVVVVVVVVVAFAGEVGYARLLLQSIESIVSDLMPVMEKGDEITN
jgi:hypothetical protein